MSDTTDHSVYGTQKTSGVTYHGIVNYMTRRVFGAKAPPLAVWNLFSNDIFAYSDVLSSFQELPSAERRSSRVCQIQALLYRDQMVVRGVFNVSCPFLYQTVVRGVFKVSCSPRLLPRPAVNPVQTRI